MNEALTPKETKKPEPILSRRALINALKDRVEVIQMLQNKPYTCMQIRSWYNEKEYMGFGFSKVCYPDEWDETTGVSIAVQRALYMIYHQIRSRELAESRIHAFAMMLQETIERQENE